MTIQPTINLTVTPEQQAAADAFKPGVYTMDPDVYHADPVPGGSLSSTGARRLLSPSCPALFHHEQLHPTPRTKAMTLGAAAHRAVLSAGEEIVVVEADDWKTKAAREAREAATKAGKIAILPHENAVVEAMAERLRQHPWAGPLLRPEIGKPEQALFWRDHPRTPWRRALLDFLPNTPNPGHQMFLPDYKTCVKADIDSVSRAVYTYGLHQQADWYKAGVEALGLAPWGVRFVFIFQEKTAPYLVNVVELDVNAMRIGNKLNKLALIEYAECTRSGVWPGYSDKIQTASLPYWVERQHEGEAW